MQFRLDSKITLQLIILMAEERSSVPCSPCLARVHPLPSTACNLYRYNNQHTKPHDARFHTTIQYYHYYHYYQVLPQTYMYVVCIHVLLIIPLYVVASCLPGSLFLYVQFYTRYLFFYILYSVFLQTLVTQNLTSDHESSS